MTTVFRDPGGDTGNTTQLFASILGAPTLVTDFVNSGHHYSSQFPASSNIFLRTATGIITDTGYRWSCWAYFTAYPANATHGFAQAMNAASTAIWQCRIDNAGHAVLLNTGTTLATSTLTMPLNTWTQISGACTITSSSVNEFRVWIGNQLAITLTNQTLTNITSSLFGWRHETSDTASDYRLSDYWIDDSASLAYPGAVYVTNNRPCPTGSASQFSTNGSSSGYGSGHAGYVNERPSSDSDFLSVVGAGSPLTEELSVEPWNVGDIDLAFAQLLDVCGWIRASSVISETGQIVVCGTATNIALTNTTTVFTQRAAAVVFPAGGTDIGIVTSATATTVSFFEGGILVAYVPGMASADARPLPCPRTRPHRTTVFLG